MILNGNYGHGGDTYKNCVELDFSANVNPLGTPEEVKRAVSASSEKIAVYPDPYCGALREKLAENLGTAEENILCGSGAAELIFQFVLAARPKKVLLPVPSFSEYESALKIADCEIVYYPIRREDDFCLTEEILSAITPEISALMLCNPNNPTGKTIPRGLMGKILEKCRETRTWLFLDECFYDFVTDEEKAYTLLPQLLEGDRVLLLRAFTKMYGMAGVRLGYCISRDHEILSRMCEFSQPWNVSAPAQAAGEAALACKEYPEKTRALIREEKAYLVSEMEKLGFKVVLGEANFLMFTYKEGLYEKLLERKILIRRCGNYKGLSNSDYRIAVKTHAENEKLLEALREICNAQNGN